MTQHILDYARLGQERPGDTPLPLRPLVDAIVAESQRDLEAQQIEVRTIVAAEATLIVRDAHLYAILKNLLLNACHALATTAGRPRAITIAFEEAPEQVVLRVEDNGAGIPESVRARIFDPFFTTKGRAGTGLGLGTVRRLVWLYGGSIAVESAVDVGTAVLVTLPRRRETAQDTKKTRSGVLLLP